MANINLNNVASKATADAHYANTSNPHSVTKTQVGLGNVDNTSDANKPVSIAQAAAIAVVQSDIDTHEARTDNPHSVTKSQVGLGNADNTSDADKPISTAQQTEFNNQAFRVPGGRLTLSSATPVMTSDVSNSTSIYYTPYLHDRIPIYDGTKFVLTQFTELTNTTTDNTKNPAAVANDSNYDLFVWNDAGTIRLGRGVAWTSATARGTGAGTTELERVNGVWVNKIAITNGAAAQRGTYVGTVRSDGSATIDCLFGGIASGGQPGFIGIWNMYHRTNKSIMVMDSDNSWSYTLTTWREKNNSVGNRVSFIRGLDEDPVQVNNIGMSSNTNVGWLMQVGVGVDSTTAFSGIVAFNNSANAGGTFTQNSAYSGYPGFGFHYVQAIEQSSAAGTTSFYGDNNLVGRIQSGMIFSGLF